MFESSQILKKRHLCEENQIQVSIPFIRFPSCAPYSRSIYRFKTIKSGRGKVDSVVLFAFHSFSLVYAHFICAYHQLTFPTCVRVGLPRSSPVRTFLLTASNQSAYRRSAQSEARELQRHIGLDARTANSSAHT